MTSFEAQVSAVTAPASTTLPPIPGSKKTPPPPPTKKTPPPPPAKASPVDDMVARASQGPLVESGIINAPNSPLKLAATPEEAAEAQGIKIVSQSDVAEQEIDLVPAADDLEALDAPQLKLLATSLGLEFLPRARAAGLRELIRNARATKVPADLTPFEQDIVDTTVQLMNSREADILAEYEATEVKLPAAPKAEPTGYDLFVNCAPQGRPYVTLSTLITLLSANFTEVTGCVDYRAVDYGKGPGLMAESLADELSTASGCIVVDTRTHEGAAFCVTLERFARSIVRGF